jgi:hypothetical protein
MSLPHILPELGESGLQQLFRRLLKVKADDFIRYRGVVDKLLDCALVLSGPLK